MCVYSMSVKAQEKMNTFDSFPCNQRNGVDDGKGTDNSCATLKLCLFFLLSCVCASEKSKKIRTP